MDASVDVSFLPPPVVGDDADTVHADIAGSSRFVDLCRSYAPGFIFVRQSLIPLEPH